MGPGRLRELLSQVVAAAVDDGLLPAPIPGGELPDPDFRPVDSRSAGVIADWVSPVASRWAPALGVPAPRLAEVLAQGLTQRVEVEAVEVTPAALMAITLTALARAEVLEVIAADQHFACDHQERSAGDRPHEALQGVAPSGWSLRPALLEHARLRRVLRNAEAAGVSARAVDHHATLDHVSERSLQVALADLPQRLERAAGDPTRQRRALNDLAELSGACRRPTRPALVGDAVTPEQSARLTLARATALVLRNGLRRMGADAPERM